MREARTRAHRRRARLVPMLALAATLAAVLPGAAQPPPGRTPIPVWAQPKRPPTTPPNPSRGGQTAPAPGATAVILRVAGRPVTQLDFDRIATPYFQRLRAELGPGFTGDIEKMANLNVLEELIRREILAVESQREKIEATPSEVDSLLMQDPFFSVDGKFDPVRFNSFKVTPGTNYLQVLPRIREMVAMNKLDAMLRRRFTPTPAQVRAEWARRGDQVRLEMLPLMTHDMSLEPEASDAERDQYYRAHPDQFMRKTRLRLRYARLSLPPPGDSTRAAAEARVMKRADALADSLRRRTLPDTALELADSGPFEIPAQFIPGLGRLPALTDTLGRLDEDSTIRVVGPYAMTDAVIVGAVAGREPKHVPPLHEVLADVKRRADAETRRLANEADRRAYFDAHRDRWHSVRAVLTRVRLSAASVPLPPPPPAPEVERWYARHGHSLFGVSDTSRAWLPPLNDSLRAVVRTRLSEEQRGQRMAEALGRVAAAMRTTRDVRAAARANGAEAETLSLAKSFPVDTVFRTGFSDSVLATAAAMKGVVQGPRAFGSTWAVWRVDEADTAFVPSYESVRGASDQAFADDRRRKDEADGKAYFEQHRGEFKTPVKYALDFVVVRVPPADSVRIPAAEIRREYDANPKVYRQEEQVQARHILFTPSGATPDADRKALARADSLLAAIKKGAGDFAELAREFSQEPGAASSGGDLGWFGRGRMVREFEEAAFKLKPGEISLVVKTQFGYHIIRCEGRKPAGLRPFDEVRDQIRHQLAQARGDSTARRNATTLRRRLALAADARTIAAPYGGVMSAGPIAVNEALPTVGFIPGLAQALPSLTAGKWSEVLHTGAGYVLVRLREKLPERPASFEEVTPQTVDAMRAAQRADLLAHKVAAVRAGLAAGATLDSLALPFGGLRDSGFLSQSSGFVPTIGTEPRVLAKAFALKPGETTDTLQVAAGVVWLRLAERKSADPATFKAASLQIENELFKQKYDAWLEGRKKTVTIEVLRPDLKAARAPMTKAVVTMGG